VFLLPGSLIFAGMCVGSLLSGWLLDRFGFQQAFLALAIIGAAAFLVRAGVAVKLLIV
jgi:MFS family permease